MRTLDATGLKLSNRKVVFDIIRRKKTVTRVELARMTGMSGPSILAIVNDFIDRGILIAGEKKNGARGRSPIEMTYNPNVILSIGIEFEGNGLSIGLVNLDGEILIKTENRVPAKLDDRFFAELEDGIAKITELAVKDGYDYYGIGFGIPGVVNPETRTVIFAPYVGVMEPTDISGALQRIEERFGKPVFIENDVNASAQGEYYLRGADRENGDGIYVSIGSGIGAGILLNGKIRRGQRGISGEIGYSLNSVSETVSRQQTGWLESKLSYHTLCEEFEEYRLYGKVSEEMAAYVAAILSPFLANLVNTLDIDTVVLGGQLILNGGEDLIERLRRELNHLTLITVELSSEKNLYSGVVGSALLAADKLYDSIL